MVHAGLVQRLIESESRPNSTEALEFERFAGRVELALSAFFTALVVLVIALLVSRRFSP